MKNKFNGYYFKHQKEGLTVALIPGYASDGAFIQMITNNRSYHFPIKNMTMNSIIQADGCFFSKSGILIDLTSVSGKITYYDSLPLQSDIMGFFRFFPLECRHGVISMKHRLQGSLTIDGTHYDFSDGTGYIEKDSGTSFPKSYIWIQCNDFPEDSSIMVSIAEIPFAGITFTGCICAIIHNKKEYRLATYHGVRFSISKDSIILKQKNQRLEINFQTSEISHALASPVKGTMSGIIHESNSVKAQFRFFEDEQEIFNLSSNYAGFERFNM